MATRIGVDVGGTFTDLIYYVDETGEVLVAKEPTSPSEPEVGVLGAVEAAVAEPDLVASAYFLHGTTVGLNALLERRGAVVGLLATRGFRDVLEIRRGDRDDPYDLFWKQPSPLVPRRLRAPVTQRMQADGTEITPLEPADVSAAAETFAAEGVNAVAIAFLHAYANPQHELEAERLLRAAGFEGDISLSHRVSGEYREYERTCTTVIDAFVRRRLGPYLGRLENRLRERGFRGGVLIMRSGGGAMTFAEAAERPFETILSGPVAGAEAVADLAREMDLDMAIGADVGGTSFDTCLVVDGRPPLLYEGTVIGLPIQTPWVDVRSIGSGGGSIVHVDQGGLLRVGPQSAGADPGPACYGKGGRQATVTDAAVVLGMLPVGALAGGVRLSPELAAAALEPLAERVGFGSAHEVARGVMRIAAAQMADAIRSITVERGRDPRESALVAFGGAGPLFATLLADELGVSTLVVPPHAGNFSAWGMLGAGLARTASRTRLLRLTQDGLGAAREIGQELFGELDGRAAESLPAGRREVHLDVRYVGQEHTLTVHAPAPDGMLSDDADALTGIFAAEYERMFGHTMEEDVEIVCVRAISAGPLERGAPAAPTPRSAAGDHGQTVPGWSFTRGEECAFAIVERDTLAVEDVVTGPAIVLEPTTTTFLDAGFTARVHAGGSLVVHREEAP
ncbi:MAG: hydantoinase/oxoprolinase family protein [Gaiellales bacterium]